MDENPDSLRQQIYASMDMKDTQELLEIWGANDRDAWSDQAFDVIEEILRKRNAEMPVQPSDAEKEITRKSTVKKVKEKDYSNIGGWLYLVGIGIVLNPLLLLVRFGRMILFILGGSWVAWFVPGTTVFNPFWAPLILYEFFGVLALLILSIVVAVLFIQKHPALPKIFITFLLLNLVYVVVNYFLLYGAAGQGDESTIVRSVIPCLIWIPYFLMSKRVKGTFVHRPDRALEPGPDAANLQHWVI